MIWVLIGIGANKFELPALVWSNKEEALKQCCALLGDNPKVFTEDGIEAFTWDIKPGDHLKDIYTSYYGGCGECYGFFLTPVDEGIPFTHWDLD